MDKDLLFLLGTKLDLANLLNFCTSNKKFNELIYGRNDIWNYKLKDYSADFLNKFSNLTPVEKYKMIYTLEYIKNYFYETTNTIYDIYELKILEIKHLGKSLESLPKNFGNIFNLEELYITNNYLTKLPQSFSNLSNLKILDLQSNTLFILPENFGNLSNLEELYLYDNELVQLPESFGNLTKLNFLGLSDNRLTTLPQNFGNLTTLENLYLNGNRLTTLPENFDNLIKLKYLSLSDNNFKNVPESLCNLKNLVELFYNGLSHLNLEKLKCKINFNEIF